MTFFWHLVLAVLGYGPKNLHINIKTSGPPVESVGSNSGAYTHTSTGQDATWQVKREHTHNTTTFVIVRVGVRVRVTLHGWSPSRSQRTVVKVRFASLGVCLHACSYAERSRRRHLSYSLSATKLPDAAGGQLRRSQSSMTKSPMSSSASRPSIVRSIVAQPAWWCQSDARQLTTAHDRVDARLRVRDRVRVTAAHSTRKAVKRTRHVHACGGNIGHLVQSGVVATSHTACARPPRPQTTRGPQTTRRPQTTRPRSP